MPDFIYEIIHEATGDGVDWALTEATAIYLSRDEGLTYYEKTDFSEGDLKFAREQEEDLAQDAIDWLGLTNGTAVRVGAGMDAPTYHEGEAVTVGRRAVVIEKITPKRVRVRDLETGKTSAVKKENLRKAD